jgi:hypothetical protein
VGFIWQEFLIGKYCLPRFPFHFHNFFLFAGWSIATLQKAIIRKVALKMMSINLNSSDDTRMAKAKASPLFPSNKQMTIHVL